MTAATLIRTPALRDAGRRSRALIAPGEMHAALAPRDGWRPTLDELLVGVWEGLRDDDETGCPVCGGAMVAHAPAGHPPVAGGCRECGSTMS